MNICNTNPSSKSCEIPHLTCEKWIKTPSIINHHYSMVQFYGPDIIRTNQPTPPHLQPATALLHAMRHERKTPKQTTHAKYLLAAEQLIRKIYCHQLQRKTLYRYSISNYMHDFTSGAAGSRTAASQTPTGLQNIPTTTRFLVTNECNTRNIFGFVFDH